MYIVVPAGAVTSIGFRMMSGRFVFVGYTLIPVALEYHANVNCSLSVLAKTYFPTNSAAQEKI